MNSPRHDETPLGAFGLPSGNGAQALRMLLDHAAAILAVHTSCGGMCGGCLDTWARLAPFPCEQRRWAIAVRERHGANEWRALETTRPAVR